MSAIPNLVEDLNDHLCKRLWTMNAKPDTLTTLLLVPQYQSGDKKLRFSEQEARCALIQVLNETYTHSDSPIYYSVETPTSGKHNFQEKIKPTEGKLPDSELTSSEDVKKNSSNNVRSALIDMSLYRGRENGVPPFCNIEFKAGVANEQAIYKDIAKFHIDQQQEQTAWFFHLINRADRNTFKRLYENTIRAIRRHANAIGPDEKTNIVFSYCVLEDLTNNMHRAWSVMISVTIHESLATPASAAYDALSWLKDRDVLESARSKGFLCAEYN